jgi:hypothetical protein
MKKTYATPLVTASDVVRATEVGTITTTSRESKTFFHTPL